MGYQLKVTVRAKDNVGLDWIRFRIEGRGEDEVKFDDNVNNTTATAYFKCDLLGSVFLGYDLNITVCDRNGNAGFLEQHINSILENFIAWVLGAVTALAKFVMELASAAINWIWLYVENAISKIFQPIISASNSYFNNLISSLETSINKYMVNESVYEEEKNIYSNAFYSPFFIGLFIFNLLLILIISILHYFMPIVSGIITAVLCVAYSILTIYALGKVVESDDIDIDLPDTVSFSFDKEAILNDFISRIPSPDSSSSTRYTFWEWVAVLVAAQLTVDTLILVASIQIWGKPTTLKDKFLLGLATSFILFGVLAAIYVTSNLPLWLIQVAGAVTAVTALIGMSLALMSAIDFSREKLWGLTAYAIVSIVLNTLVHGVGIVMIGMPETIP